MVLKEDGGVAAWGYNNRGETTVPTTALIGVTAISAGETHTVALKDDGSVIGWGYQLAGHAAMPVEVSSGVSEISAGTYHTLALKNGSVIAWGYNSNGQTNVPASALSEVKAISGGLRHSVALKEDGSVIAWGYNSNGQTNVPASALSEVKAISAGGLHTLALKENGSVIAWGSNQYGQSTVPASALNGVVAIAAGGHHSMALKEDGSIVTWGLDNFQQTTIPTSAYYSPVDTSLNYDSATYTVTLAPNTELLYETIYLASVFGSSANGDPMSEIFEWTITTESADIDGDGFTVSQGDCDDSNNTVYPGASEICDNLDNNCDGSVDENLTNQTTCGVGACAGNTGIETCSAGVWWGNNCDPWLGATADICDGIDNDCDSQIDEGLICSLDNPVQLETTLGTHLTIQEAYDRIPVGETAKIKVKAGEQGLENLIFDQDVSIWFEGGYNNTLTDKVLGTDSSFSGSLSISSGTTTISDIIIK